MADMWMLSVAAALIEHVQDADSPALAALEKAARSAPNLGDALDAARAAGDDDRIPLAEALADGLKAVYDQGGAFAILLDTLWPEVLFGPRANRGGNVVIGDITGHLVQADSIVGHINFPS
ncbi:hypothetical protein [Kutzneria sp. CA-103260]|uniref:hypothetical protein n=1 Tax=Kutzneria sp. CA-103260 TaxID=2802641 RepID=UPI001BABB8D3|nr:hypothetical protein [Kutzneria sp. CA-103260]QUQ66326.1 hypothetical protein JJ691_40530 [Kutzneria sp. CA-103260]